MTTWRYKQPPLVQTYLGHAVGTAVLGALLPPGDKLGHIHALVQPLVELIPNAVRITQRTADPVFAQTFLGLSLLMALAILVFYVVAMRGYHTRTFETTGKRLLLLAQAWVVVFPVLALLWWAPYLDPLSKGKAHFLINAAVSSHSGVITAMNQLIVGMPLVCCLLLWGVHACTSTRHKTGSI